MAALRPRLRALAAIAPDTRGRRFAARVRGEALPVFDDLVAMPVWGALADADRDRVARAAALIEARPAIDRAIDGVRLAALVEAVTEDVFDAVCALPLDNDIASSSQLLPRPDRLDARGREILARAVPVALARAVPGAAGDARMRRIADAAVMVIGAAA